MKLTEMPLDKARDCFVELAPHLGALAADPDVMSYFKGEKQENPLASLVDLAGRLMRDHYEALVCILSALTGEPKAAIRQTPAVEVFQLIKSVVHDEDLKALFTA